MLVSFGIKNFKSFKDKKTIYMTPASKYHRAEANAKFKNNVFKTGEKSQEELLKTAVIYGANASGKTNIVEAMLYFREIFLTSQRKRGDSLIQYSRPFVFDKETVSGCCEFEIDIIINSKRYVYEFSFNKEQICSESLDLLTEKDKRENIYRISMNGNNEYDIVLSDLFGDKSKYTVKEDTFKNTKNNLFLVLVASDIGHSILTQIYDWIKTKLIIANIHIIAIAVELIKKDESYKTDILNLMKKADIGISDFKISEERNVPPNSNHFNVIQSKISFEHKGGSLPIEQESQGTRVLFALSGLIFPILKNGGVLFFDELENSLHPDLLIYIIKMFYNPKINIGNGQLIFTAHNDILLDSSYCKNLFRRDQIWFTSRNPEGESKTDLYSLVEFKSDNLKKRDNIVKKYRNYDFGARPVLREFCWS